MQVPKRLNPFEIRAVSRRILLEEMIKGGLNPFEIRAVSRRDKMQEFLYVGS